MLYRSVNLILPCELRYISLDIKDLHSTLMLMNFVFRIHFCLINVYLKLSFGLFSERMFRFEFLVDKVSRYFSFLTTWLCDKRRSAMVFT